MKKNHYGLISGVCKIWKSKFLKRMRIVILLFLISITQTFALNAYAQNKRLSVNFKNEKIINILDKIEDQSEFYFMFDASRINVNQRKTVDCENQLITKILDQLFEGTGITYSINDRQVLLTIIDKSDTEQQKTVSGKVTDSFGFALPGVTIVIKGTTIGTITDNDGSYSISVPSDATLVFSFVGMKTLEISMKGRTVMDLKMEEEAIGLDEVVAIGYGTMKKSDLTGAVASYKFEDVNKKSNISLMQTLQGAVPGLNVGAVTKAGEDPAITIRGYNSLSAGQTPLIVVDGIIYEGSIGDLNPNDIEQVDILKDASSAAVYGSKSANGVIIITTKKGKSEKPVFNFNTHYGIQEISHKVKMADGEKYIQKLLDIRAAAGFEADPENIESYLQPLEVQNYRNKHYIDWVDFLTQNAPIQQYDLSVSGKTSKTNYYLSGSYTDQEGIILGDNFSRVTLRANFSNEITNWLTIGMNISYSNKDFSGKEVPFSVFASPLSTIYANEETGELNLYPHNDQMTVNPLSYLNVKDKEIYNNLFSNLYTDIKIAKIKGLNFHFDYSNNLTFGKHNQFSGTDTKAGIDAPNGLATKNIQEYHRWSVNNILSYSTKFGKNAIDATFLYSREKATLESTFAKATNFEIETLGWNALGLGSVQENSSAASDNSSEALMSRLSYSYNMRYLLTATYRRDGYSGFSRGNKYADFPSISLGWVISEENFAKSLDWLSYLKMRLSYGINGNQSLGSYGSLSKMGLSYYVFGDGGNTSVGTYPSSLSNNELVWEKTKSLNLGFNINVLDNKISTELDIYKGSTNDLLVQRGLSGMTGYSSVWTNLGEIQNKGIEITINTLNISKTDFSWDTRFSFSLNRNKISKLYGIDNNGDGIDDDDIGNGWFVGKSIGAIYDYTLDGIYQLNDSDIPDGFYPGYFRLKDTDGVSGITSNDRSVIGYSLPSYRFSIFNKLEYKKFSLSFMINSIQGGGKDNYYIKNNRIGLDANATFFGSAGRINIPDIDYWSATNPSNTIPSIAYNPKYSHGIYQDRSFVRLQDISLSYKFDRKFIKKLDVNDLVVFVSGKNLLTWTNFTGWDPESGATLSDEPSMRSIVAGINLNF